MSRVSRRLVAVIGVAAVAAIGGFFLLSGTADPDPLREVAEPIHFTEGLTWDSGGIGLTYVDANGVERAVCLLDDEDGNTNLLIGTISPGRDPRRRADDPIGGPREQAFVRLLRSWRQEDAEAGWWDAQWDRYERGEIGSPEIGSPTGTLDVNGHAVLLLRKLRRWGRA